MILSGEGSQEGTKGRRIKGVVHSRGGHVQCCNGGRAGTTWTVCANEVKVWCCESVRKEGVMLCKMQGDAWWTHLFLSPSPLLSLPHAQPWKLLIDKWERSHVSAQHGLASLNMITLLLDKGNELVSIMNMVIVNWVGTSICTHSWDLAKYVVILLVPLAAEPLCLSVSWTGLVIDNFIVPKVIETRVLPLYHGIFHMKCSVAGSSAQHRTETWLQL